MPAEVSRRILAAVVVAAYILVPAGMNVQLALQRPAWTVGWALNVMFIGSIFGYWFAAGAWYWFGSTFRWLLAVAALAAAVHGRIYGAALALAVGTVAARLTLGKAGQPPDDIIPIGLDLPFNSGRYYIGQGGNSSRFNHHFRSRSQRYALDIVQIGPLGMRARGLYPARLDRYFIYGTPVVSPCEGIVTCAVDDLPDLAPPHRDRSHLAGNFVMIAADGSDVYVCLAHLQNGSVQVRTGDRVYTGQPIARVGNSGNTTEPHLHLQAKRGGSPTSLLDGEGVPMLIQGRFLRRNSRFRYTGGHVPAPVENV